MESSIVRSVLAVAMLLGSVGIISPASAQHQAVAVSQSAPYAQKRITISVPRVSLQTALYMVAKKAGIVLVLNDAALGKDRSAALDARDLRIDHAFSQLLQGTGLVARFGSEGHVAIVRAPQGTIDGTIMGKVVHTGTRRPLAGVRVLIEGTNQEMVTDAAGIVRFTVPAGEYTVAVRGVGFSRQRKAVTVQEGMAEAIEFILTPSASVLDEVIVTGTVIATERKAVTTPITVITAEDIERRGITRIEQLMRGEIPGLLAGDRGIWSYAEGDGHMVRSNVYSRGSASLDGAPNPIKTFVDGVEVLDPSYLGAIDPASIERIEIVTGPQAASIYGSGAMAGVMQIFTKAGSRNAAPEFRLSLRYGVLQSNLSPSYTPTHMHSLDVRGGYESVFSYNGTLSYTYSGQWQPELFSRRTAISAGATIKRNGFVAAGAVSLVGGSNGMYSGDGSISPCGMVSNLCYSSILSEKYKESGEFVPSPTYISSPKVSKSQNQTISLNLDYQPGRFWQHHLTAGLNQTGYKIDPMSPALISSSDTLFNTQDIFGRRTSASYNTTLLPQIGAVSSVITLGMSGSWGWQTSVYGCLVTKSASSMTGCWAGGGPIVNRPETGESWGGFGNVRVGLFEQLFANFSLRGEKNPAYGADHSIDWTPTAGLAYTFEFAELTVKALTSYGKATRPPFLSYRQEALITNAIWDPVPWVEQLESPRLAPEYSRGPQGGVEMYYGNIGSITINHYQQKVTNLIQRIVVDSLYIRYVPGDFYQWMQQSQYVNIAAMKQYGWEGTGSLNVGAFAVKGSYSWSDSRITKLGIFAGYDAGQSFRNLPTHYGSTSITYAHRGTSLSLVANWIGKTVQSTAADPLYHLRRRGRMAMYTDQRNPQVAGQVKPDYAKADVALTQRINAIATFTLNVTNATNSYESDWGGLFPTLGRQTVFGISLRHR